MLRKGNNMTRKQVWKTIGDASRYAERTRFQRDITSKGLCEAVQQLYHFDLITGKEKITYLDCLAQIWPQRIGRYWSTIKCQSSDYIRASFVYFLSDLKEKELLWKN